MGSIINKLNNLNKYSIKINSVVNFAKCDFYITFALYFWRVVRVV